MSSGYLARLLQQRSQSGIVRFDESLVPGTCPAELENSLTRRFLRGDLIDEGVSENAARKLRLVADDDDGVARLTLTGVLLCTREPQRWLPHAYVQAVSYAGERTDINYQTDARDISGPLDEQVAEALHFVRKNMLVRATKTTGRTDRPQFSERAVFEALVNAVAHRDYSMAGSRVRLHTTRTVADHQQQDMDAAVSRVLTIGHSVHPLEAFVALLRRYEVAKVMDIRSTPYSRFNPQFNRESLARSLAGCGIEYVFFGVELGGRSDDPSCYENGRIRYDRVAATSSFRRGLDRVVRGAGGRTVALTCAEKEPLNCHRTLLVAQALATREVTVSHILAAPMPTVPLNATRAGLDASQIADGCASGCFRSATS